MTDRSPITDSRRADLQHRLHQRDRPVGSILPRYAAGSALRVRLLRSSANGDDGS